MIDDKTPLLPPPPGQRRSRGARIFWSVFVLLVAAAAGLLFAPRGALEPEPVQTTSPEQPVESRPVNLYFSDPEAQRLVAEEREMPPSESMETGLAAVLQALADGPQKNGAVRTLPEQVRVRRVFFDDSNATAYIDFDPALVTRHPGGSTAESITLGSILRTVGANFPEITRVQILVDGETVESIAGHFDTSKPIEIAAWP
jgi:spore germination protein GerM